MVGHADSDPNPMPKCNCNISLNRAPIDTIYSSTQNNALFVVAVPSFNFLNGKAILDPIGQFKVLSSY